LSIDWRYYPSVNQRKETAMTESILNSLKIQATAKGFRVRVTPSGRTFEVYGPTGLLLGFASAVDEGQCIALLDSVIVTVDRQRKENEWEKIVAAGNSFDLSGSYTDWRMVALDNGSYVMFYQGDHYRFSIQGALTPQQGVQFVGAFVAGFGVGVATGKRTTQEKIRAALGL
jgi:hypothetical protein